MVAGDARLCGVHRDDPRRANRGCNRLDIGQLEGACTLFRDLAEDSATSWRSHLPGSLARSVLGRLGTRPDRLSARRSLAAKPPVLGTSNYRLIITTTISRSNRTTRNRATR